MDTTWVSASNTIISNSDIAKECHLHLLALHPIVQCDKRLERNVQAESWVMYNLSTIAYVNLSSRAFSVQASRLAKKTPFHIRINSVDSWIRRVLSLGKLNSHCAAYSTQATWLIGTSSNGAEVILVHRCTSADILWNGYFSILLTQAYKLVTWALCSTQTSIMSDFFFHVQHLNAHNLNYASVLRGIAVAILSMFLWNTFYSRRKIHPGSSLGQLPGPRMHWQTFLTGVYQTVFHYHTRSSQVESR